MVGRLHILGPALLLAGAAEAGPVFVVAEDALARAGVPGYVVAPRRDGGCEILVMAPVCLAAALSLESDGDGLRANARMPGSGATARARFQRAGSLVECVADLTCGRSVRWSLAESGAAEEHGMAGHGESPALAVLLNVLTDAQLTAHPAVRPSLAPWQDALVLGLDLWCDGRCASYARHRRPARSAGAVPSEACLRWKCGGPRAPAG